MTHRSFTSSPTRGESLTFDVNGGEPFEIPTPVPVAAILDVAGVLGSVDTTNAADGKAEMAMLGGITSLLETVLGADQWLRFRREIAVARWGFAEFEKFLTWIMEAAAARPTEPPSFSPAVPATVGAPSRAADSSQVADPSQT
jgi:hypothetical protein